MRIIVVTDQYAPMVGGVPAVTRSLATGLAQRGHSVTVLAPSTGVRSAAAMEGQTRVRYLGSLRWPWYPGMRVATIPVRAIRRHICAAAPDVVHIHSPVVLGVLANWQAARTSVPVVYTNHYLPANFAGTAGEGSPLLTSWFYSWVVSFANRCGYVTAPSTTALRLLAERGLQAPSQVISNGVDLRKFRPGPADPALAARYGLRLGRPVVLSVGRLSPEKRLDVLLAAAGRLACECQLVVVGAGPQEAALHAMVAGQGTADRVTFLGHVPDADLPGIYRLGDVFAIASQAELQSLVTMEAMASGLPVVAADAYALSELVSHGANGYLFGRGQSSELASYLDELNADKDARLRMGRESLRIIARHGQDSTLAQWESVYALMAGKYLRAAA
ncbi:MAG TPA: glycosyltransferase [Streptosporangiaceae bacterium]|nr:glycosyltransferase [Streptosporangiaceae bacterium]